MNLEKTKSTIRQSTIEKYTNCLKSALIKIEKNATFTTRQFVFDNHLPSGFFNAVIALKYIYSTGSTANAKYRGIMTPGIINSSHGEAIARWLIDYNYKHATNVPTHKQDEKIREDVQKLGLEKAMEKILDQRAFNARSLLTINREVFELTDGGIKRPLNQLIKEIPDEALLEELKKRGYKGNLTKTNKIAV